MTRPSALPRGTSSGEVARVIWVRIRFWPSCTEIMAILYAPGRYPLWNPLIPRASPASGRRLLAFLLPFCYHSARRGDRRRPCFPSVASPVEVHGERDRGMAELALDVDRALALLEQERGEAVSERVR